MTVVCWYCRDRSRKVRKCDICKHFVCGCKDCPGSPCPTLRSLGADIGAEPRQTGRTPGRVKKQRVIRSLDRG